MPIACVVSVKGIGSPPEHIVWFDAITPAEILFTVTVNTFDIAVHKTPFKVLVAINW